jgi:hypothetical protein
MKELILQIAGVKNEKEFYSLFPTQEAFFEAHPEAQQIIANYQQQMSMPTSEEEVEEYGNGGYTVRKSNDRKGKTHVVTGPDGTKKYFGDPSMGEKGKSEHGKEAFYARHKQNLANNPYFRAYAKATWADGGILPEVENYMLAGFNTDDYFDSSLVNTFAMGGGINIKPENKGKFTNWANRHDMGVQEAANHVMANQDRYSTNVVQMANFARNAAKWKKENGGNIDALAQYSNKVPVQTETYQGQPEQVVLPNGTIQSVEATQSHENMNDGEITDVLPTGSHIQSSRNKLTPEQYAQLINMFMPEQAEKQMKQLESISKGKNKKLSPAEISEYAKKNFQKESTPNSFDTDKLKEGNKKSYLDLSIKMNDLIKAGKELAEGVLPTNEMMAYGGMIPKYPWGTDANGLSVWIPGGEDPLTRNILQEEGNLPTIPNDLAQAMKAGYLKYDPSIKKYRANLPKDMPYKEKIRLGQAIEERMGLQNVRQSKTPGYDNFFGGNTPYDYARFFVENTTGKLYNDNVTEKEVVKDYFKLLGTTPSEEDLKNPASLFKIPGFDKAYQAYVTQTPGMRESYGVPTLGDTPSILGMQQWKARPLKVQATPEATPVVEETPAQQAENLVLGNVNAIPGARQIPMQNRFNFGLLEGQLGRGLAANEAYLNAAMDLSPVYTMETPDTFIRSRRNEIPVGNILYNIERAQRNSANALAAQTGDWSTLAGNIANSGAQAYNQIGDTLSALNEKNLGLYNTTQDLQQNLLSSNVGVRNQNLTNMQNMINYKRNLSGQKAVKDAELYSKYVKSMSENSQEEQNQKLAMLNIMASKPDMFKGEQGQRFANQIMGNYGSYNNPFAGSILDFGLNNLFK